MLVCLAGLIAANRLERENQLEVRNEELTAQLRDLLAVEQTRLPVAPEEPEPVDDESSGDRLDPV